MQYNDWVMFQIILCRLMEVVRQAKMTFEMLWRAGVPIVTASEHWLDLGGRF